MLDDQVNNISMFNDNKIIFISEVSDKIASRIDNIIEEPRNHVKLILFSQNLEKKSKIRSVLEKSKNVE